MNKKTTPVPIPKENTYIAKRGQYEYVFHIDYQGYDKKTKGRKQCKLTSIGSLCQDRETMIPNANYFRLYNESTFDILKEPNSDFNDRLSFGQFALINHAAKKCGCLDALEKVFPKIAHKIYAFAQYNLVSRSTVAQHFENYVYSNYTGLHKKISDSEISEMFNTHIPYAKIDEFQKVWVESKYNF